MNRFILALFTMVFILASSPIVFSENIQPNIWEFKKDYYDVIGEPQLSASIVGDPELDSGETTRLFIQLMNDGLVYGFENEKSPNPADPDEVANAQTELNLEYDVTTAVSIRGILQNNKQAPVRIISGLQQAGSLRSGETSQPMVFDIEVFRNAPSGIYELDLNLTYIYQFDVKVEGMMEQPQIDYWYMTKNQTVPVKIIIKPEAHFEVVNVDAVLRPGEQSILSITYRNTGNEVAKDAVARISVVDPFSTTDDQAFLGTLNPGDSYDASYRIKVDRDSLPKMYGINTEIKYRDQHNDIQISDVMKAQVIVEEPITLGERIGFFGYILIAAAIFGAAGLYFSRKI